MRGRPTILALLLTLLPAGVGGAQSNNTAPDCVAVRAEPFLGAYGSTHIVVVENRCDRPVRCDVATTVDPTPRHRLEVGPGQTGSVATRAEAAGAVFRALYTCDFI